MRYSVGTRKNLRLAKPGRGFLIGKEKTRNAVTPDDKTRLPTGGCPPCASRSLRPAGAELVILQVSEETDEDGEQYLDAIEDEDLYNRVAELFMGRLLVFLPLLVYPFWSQKSTVWRIFLSAAAACIFPPHGGLDHRCGAVGRGELRVGHVVSSLLLGLGTLLALGLKLVLLAVLVQQADNVFFHALVLVHPSVLPRAAGPPLPQAASISRASPAARIFWMVMDGSLQWS